MTTFLRPATALPGLVVLGLAVLLAGCSSGPKTPPPPDVVTQVIQPKDVPIIFNFNGTVTSVKTVQIVPRVTGNLQKRYFIEGTVVQAGDKLYLIDPRPFEASLLAAQGDLEKARASLVYWNAEVERYTTLAKKGAASQEKMQSSVAKRDETKAQILTDEANVASAELNLSYTDITAPFTGRIQNTNYHVGDLITENQDTLTTLVQLDPIYVVFNISRSQIFELQRLGETGKILSNWQEFVVRVTLPNGKLYQHAGKLNYLSSEIDPTTDNLVARAIFPNPSASNPLIDLIPGQYVAVELFVGTQKDAIVVPQTAVAIGQAGPVAFSVDKDNKVVPHRLELQRAYEQNWIVTKGLNAGDRLIVEGLAKAKPGITVNPNGKPTGPAPTESKDQAAAQDDGGSQPVKDAPPAPQPQEAQETSAAAPAASSESTPAESTSEPAAQEAPPQEKSGDEPSSQD